MNPIIAASFTISIISFQPMTKPMKMTVPSPYLCSRSFNHCLLCRAGGFWSIYLV